MSREGWPPREEFIGLDCSFWASSDECGYPKAGLEGRVDCAGVIDAYCVGKLHKNSTVPVEIHTGNNEHESEHAKRNTFITEYFKDLFSTEPSWIEVPTDIGTWKILPAQTPDGRVFVAALDGMVGLHSYAIYLDTDTPDEHLYIDSSVRLLQVAAEIDAQMELGLYSPTEDDTYNLDFLLQHLGFEPNI